MNQKTYRDSSWVSDKLEVRASPLHGVGVFAKEEIEESEVVAEWGGALLTLEAVKAGQAIPHTHVAVSETMCLATPLGAEPTIDDYMNHSCDPNIWMKDEVTLVAKRKVAAGEELTADYAIWLNDAAYRMARACNCGSPNCRKIVTGSDWQLATVVEANYPHFSPFLNHRIVGLGLTPNKKARSR